MLCYGLINRLRHSFRLPQTIGVVSVAQGGVRRVCAGRGRGELGPAMPGPIVSVFILR